MNKRQFLTKILPIAGALSVFLLCGCTKNSIKKERNGFALDTFITITVYGDTEDEVLDHAVGMLNEYEKIFSPTDPDSELYRLNHAGTVKERELSPQLARVISTGLKFSGETSGAFDITIRPVGELWDFTSGEEKIPDGELIREKLKLVDYRKVKLEGNRISFEIPGMMVDTGAVAKGYIADRIKEYLVSQGVKSGIINLGGNVLCIGRRPDGKPFAIGLENPFSRGETWEKVEVDDGSVVTSGVYERHFIKNGVNYHHILDPKTGYPYVSDIAAVSVVCGSSETADVLSTCAFCLGTSKGSELLRRYDAKGFFIMEDSSVIYER